MFFVIANRKNIFKIYIYLLTLCVWSITGSLFLGGGGTLERSRARKYFSAGRRRGDISAIKDTVPFHLYSVSMLSKSAWYLLSRPRNNLLGCLEKPLGRRPSDGECMALHFHQATSHPPPLLSRLTRVPFQPICPIRVQWFWQHFWKLCFGLAKICKNIFGKEFSYILWRFYLKSVFLSII
jgi:hypothetical protein